MLLDGLSAVPCDEERLLDEVCDALQGGKEKGREKEHRKREPIPAQRSVLLHRPGFCPTLACASALPAVRKCQAAIEELDCCSRMDAAAGSPRRAVQENDK